MRSNDLKWRLNEEDATLKLHHGKLNPEVMVRLSSGKMNEKTPHNLSGCAGSSSRLFSLDSFSDFTRFRWQNVVNIDHISPESRKLPAKPNKLSATGPQPTRLHSSTGIATCSTISRPNPSSAGMCIGVFDRSRMR
jgi:hypothetical protein